MKNGFFLKLLLIVSVFLSCEEEETIAVSVESVKILNDERSALKAKLIIELSEAADVQIKFWSEGVAEEDATLLLSDNKKNHTITLFELNENTTYNYKIIVTGESSTFSKVQSFTTASVPLWVKNFYKEDNEINDGDDGYYLFASMTKPGCLYLVNKTGKIVWYKTSPNVIKTARLTKRNTIITLEDNMDNPMGDGNIVLETSWADDTLFYQVKGQKGFDRVAHHDVQVHSNGNIVLITNEVENNLPGDGLLVLNPRGEKVWSWSTFDEIKNINLSTYKQPWANSLFIDKDDNYIVSFRSLCQVWKINATTGVVMWKLGKNGDVKIDDSGSSFLFQHYAHRNNNDEIMLFDNGDATRPLSRAISFSINETSKEAVTKIKATLPASLYSVIMGSTIFLPDGNILSASAVNGRIVKMGTSGEVRWTLKTADRIYRVEYVSEPFK
jgi:arylsulfate sulfotransferase